MKQRILSLALGLLMVSAGAFGAMQMGIVGAASATATGTTYASVTELTGESYNGQVDGITVSSTGYAEWDNMPDDVENVTVTLEAKHNGTWQEFASKTYSDVPSSGDGDYSYDVVSGDLIENTDFTSEDFSESGDGESRKEYVTVRVTVTVTSADGTTCDFSEVHKIKTVVSNLTDPMATGNTTVGGEIEMDESTPECDVC